MEYFIICFASLIVSMITLFSGFGLGTVLMPIFALFFPLPLAVASTAVVHLANNIFKAAIVGKLAKVSVVIKFGVPAVFASALGAYLLGMISYWPAVTMYEIQHHTFKITYVGLAVGFIIVLSSLLELIPKFSKLSFSPQYIPIGGMLSGFFGGLSGNQGMFRSAFLIRTGLNKQEFIGTGVVCSIIVDIVRILVYGWTMYSSQFVDAISHETTGIIIAASVTAFLGSYMSARLMHKMTFQSIQLIVGAMLLFLGIGIALGMI